MICQQNVPFLRGFWYCVVQLLLAVCSLTCHRVKRHLAQQLILPVALFYFGFLTFAVGRCFLSVLLIHLQFVFPSHICLPSVSLFQGSWWPSGRWGKICSSNINWRMTFPPLFPYLPPHCQNSTINILLLPLLPSSSSFLVKRVNFIVWALFSRVISPSLLATTLLISLILSLGVGKWAGSCTDRDTGVLGNFVAPLPSSSLYSKFVKKKRMFILLVFLLSYHPLQCLCDFIYLHWVNWGNLFLWTRCFKKYPEND